MSRRRWILVGACSLIAVSSALAVMFGVPKLGQHMLERADQTHTRCSNSNYEESPGASLACEGAFRRDLAWAQRIPATRDAAAEKALVLTSEELETRLGLATDVMLDREMQSTAADELAQWMAQPGFPADRRTTQWAFAIIASSGHRRATIRHAALASDAFDRERAMRAAIVEGDFATATAIAKVHDAETHDYENELLRGAWLCLVGERDIGLATLEQAMASFEARVKGEYVEAELGVLACGGDGHGLDGTGREAVWSAEVLAKRGPPPVVHLRRTQGFSEQANDVTSALFAAWSTAEARDPEEVVAYAGLVRAQLARATTPWNFTGAGVSHLFSVTPIVVDPAVHEAAAAKLDALVVTIETRKIKVKPIGKSAAEVERWGHDEEMVRARAEPTATLRKASLVLWLEAASAHAEAFDAEGLARALARVPAAEVQGELALLVATWAFRVGDRAGARTWLTTALQMPPGIASVDAHLFLAMLELGEGRASEALAAVARAREMAGAGELELRSHPFAETLGDEVTATMHRKIGWVEAAAALAGGASKVHSKVATPDVHDAPGAPTDWFALARADDAVRKTTRFRMFSIDATHLDAAVLPAVVYVLHEVARDGKDPEVYIDSALPLHSPALNGVIALRARGEAARMRGDAAAAAAWDARAEAIQALITGPRERLLARLAGLL